MHFHEIEKTKLSSVACMGKEYPYDHPKVYLAITAEDQPVQCPYCSKTFVLTKE